jgi:hypothetical protein
VAGGAGRTQTFFVIPDENPTPWVFTKSAKETVSAAIIRHAWGELVARTRSDS